VNRLILGLLVVFGLLLYIRSPIDLLPDRMGLIGFLDDAGAVILAGWYFLRRILPPLRAAGQARASAGPRSTSNERASEKKRFDPWEVLGLEKGAGPEEIRRAYHAQLRRYHPDRVEDLGEELRQVAHERTLEIRRAYDELKGS
jgi:hypothetical protein